MKSTLVLASLLALTATASADTKSWTALKSKFPAATNVVVGVDVNAISKTSAYTKMVDSFLAEEEDAKQAFGMIKTTCGVDVPTIISDLTVFGTVGLDDDLSIAIGLNGIDSAKVTDCLQKVMDSMSGKAAGSVKVTAKTKGKVTEYTATGETKKLYIAWLAKDVILVSPDHMSDKGVLEKVIASKAAKGDLKAMLGKVNKASPLFATMILNEKEGGIEIKGGYGDVTLASGTFTAGIHVLTAKAEDAAKMVEMGKQAMADGVKEMNDKKQPELAKVLGGVTFASTGNEVTITGSITEAVLIKVVPDLDKIF